MAVTINSVMMRYGVCRSTVWRWVRDGVLPPPRVIGKRRRVFFEAELQDYERKLALAPAPGTTGRTGRKAA